MARAFYEPGPTANELAAFGFTAEDIGDQSVEIWPDTARSFELFVSLRTQWRIGMSGATGLDYAALPVVEDRVGIRADFDGLRAMEEAALAQMTENRR